MAIELDVTYDVARHAAVRTDSYLFNQLIPYIGSKRKLLSLIQQALALIEYRPGATFLDLFSGSGVVSRFAKALGYRVVSNDWEAYALPINRCYVECNEPPSFAALGGYRKAVDALNHIPPVAGWVTENLCPHDDQHCDPAEERMFFMRKNGMRIDAIREAITEWSHAGLISEREEACLLAPLLYQVCYTSNTSGVFKAYHNGWGGQTGTALYRIAGDLKLRPAVFYDNGHDNAVLCADAEAVARDLRGEEVGVAYIDPPYNQHPYATNYHVLTSVALWDKPEVSREIKRGTKAAIRTDWRNTRRSPYNHSRLATGAYKRLLDTIDARYILTSYSTEGNIPGLQLLEANVQRGLTRVVSRAYKRYRVSSQRFSHKPMNVEFVVVTDTRRSPDATADELWDRIMVQEQDALDAHPEISDSDAEQLALFGGMVGDGEEA